MTDTNQKQLGNTLWSIADPLRGAMDADDFRDDMLSFLFLRHFSDNDETAAGYWLRPSRQGLLDDSKRRRGRGAEESTATACAGARPALRSPLRGTPNPRVRRWEARDLQAGELRQAAGQHAVVADGMNPVLSTQAPEFFVSSCLRVRHSQLPGPRDCPATRCFIDHTNSRAPCALGAFAMDETSRLGPQPERFSWIGRAGSICLRKSFVVRSLQVSNWPAPRSLLGLRKHLLRNHSPPNQIVPTQGVGRNRAGGGWAPGW